MKSEVSLVFGESRVSPNFKITMVCGLMFHRHLKTVSLKFQKAMGKDLVLPSLPYLAWESPASSLKRVETEKLQF